MKGMTYANAHRESLKLLKQLDLEFVKDRKAKSCSFDTQRRICLAMALIGDTKVHYFIYNHNFIIIIIILMNCYRNLRIKY